ncbi:MAG: archaeosortase/exosortase family protein [Synechococcaceae cyanobacterium]|nr:archaeosortase/exosortase family protein [Synechococcaceae cyanobacterium]
MPEPKWSSAFVPLNRRIAQLRSRLPPPLQGWVPDLPPPTLRNLWLCLALLVACQNCWVVHTSQGSTDAVLAILLWGGGLICIEDQLEQLRPQPGWLGLFLGTLLLLWVMARSAVILSWDAVIFVLAPLAGLALSLLCLPLTRLWRFRDPLICLLLLPLFKILTMRLPEQGLSLITAKGAGFWLSSLGLFVLVDGRKVMLPGGAVTVGGPCNGIEIMAMLICVSFIFLLAFPVRSWLSRITLILIAPLLGLISNTTRIALLAILTTVDKMPGGRWFDFFHEQEGSLVFSGVAVFVFGAIYLRLLERELPPLDEDSQARPEP